MRLLIAAALAFVLVGCDRAKPANPESTLRDELFTFRQCIDQYTLDKQRAPKSLNDLVSAGYLKEIPVDPITRSRSSWHAVQCSELMSIDQTEPGICDVHSGAGGTGTDGTAYNTW